MGLRLLAACALLSAAPAAAGDPSGFYGDLARDAQGRYAGRELFFSAAGAGRVHVVVQEGRGTLIRPVLTAVSQAGKGLRFVLHDIEGRPRIFVGTLRNDGIRGGFEDERPRLFPKGCSFWQRSGARAADPAAGLYVRMEGKKRHPGGEEVLLLPSALGHVAVVLERGGGEAYPPQMVDAVVEGPRVSFLYRPVGAGDPEEFRGLLQGETIRGLGEVVLRRGRSAFQDARTAESCGLR